jgi:S-adenosylmethionine synthetase
VKLFIVGHYCPVKNLANSNKDNGLSGKKLLMDYYGPRVPTGGSALFGKDAFKPDRVNAMRARALALGEVRAKNAKEATVTLVYFPGMMSGEITRIEVQQ